MGEELTPAKRRKRGGWLRPHNFPHQTSSLGMWGREGKKRRRGNGKKGREQPRQETKQPRRLPTSTPASGFKPRAGFAVRVRPPCGQNPHSNS